MSLLIHVIIWEWLLVAHTSLFPVINWLIDFVLVIIDIEIPADSQPQKLAIVCPLYLLQKNVHMEEHNLL